MPAFIAAGSGRRARVTQLFDEVAGIMMEAAGEAILPRFGMLQSADIEDKSLGEVVTVADRHAERLIAPRLLALGPGSRVVGEEVAAHDPTLLGGLGQGDVWLVDPLDGTTNFIAGDPRFAVIVALLRDGVTVAGWLLEPVSGRLSVAELGSGAYVDGQRVESARDTLGIASMRGIVRTRFLPPDVKARVDAGSASLAQTLPGSGSAAIDYPAVAAGARRFALYWRTLPWDHAAPALFLTEAGGHVARLDRSPYLPSDARTGLLAATNADCWATAHATLVADSDIRAPG
jgi:fructose-1,6-bisphosphatase/inositol monophosphatase family enzyme